MCSKIQILNKTLPPFIHYMISNKKSIQIFIQVLVQTTLDKFARNGFLNLSSILIRALQNAGLKWGGAWTKSKDFMHFEL